MMYMHFESFMKFEVSAFSFLIRIVSACLSVACLLLSYANFFELDNLQGIPMAPLWDFCKGQFVGVLSVLDFILILREVCKYSSIDSFCWQVF